MSYYFGRNPDHLWTEEKLSELHAEKAVTEMARILALIESRAGPDGGDWTQDERYESIADCLDANCEDLDKLEEYTNEMLSSLQLAKKILIPDSGAEASLTINQSDPIQVVISQFKRIFKNIEIYIDNAAKAVIKINQLNPELLFCFFNYDTWGSTWSTELYIPKQLYDSGDREVIQSTSIDRVTKFRLWNNPRGIVEDVVHDHEEKLYNCMGPEEYDGYQYFDYDYFIINAVISRQILEYYKQILTKMRDTCRTVLSEISKYKKANDLLNDEVFKRINREVFSKLRNDPDFSKTLRDIIQKRLFTKCFTLLYDYKKEVEESEYEDTSKFENEKDFQHHLFNYLNRTRKGNMMVSKEVERGRGRIDILINNHLTIELKFYKEPAEMSAIPEHYPQLRETMQSWGSQFGFLVVMDVSRQTGPQASKENYLRTDILKGGRGIRAVDDRNPAVVVSMLIFGGNRAKPSDF